MSKKVKDKISYGYYIDVEGLYYVSTKSGEPYESFDINGVCAVTEFQDIDLIYLCYIPEDENTES